MTYTYDEDIFSDLHKDAYGFRPRDHEFYDATPDRKQEIWDYFCGIVEENIAAERENQERAVRDFEQEVQNTIGLGASDRATALRWMTQNDLFYHEQSVEHWVWERGILFTDEGRKLVKDLMNIVKFENIS